MNKSHIKNFIAAGFILLFCSYYVNATLFVHSHIINGVTIVHSHVHSPIHHTTQDGEHSATQITLIAHLNAQLLLTTVGLMAALMVIFSLIAVLGEVCQSECTNHVHLFFSLRAPPILN